jgi:hypothetical protein
LSTTTKCDSALQQQEQDAQHNVVHHDDLSRQEQDAHHNVIHHDRETVEHKEQADSKIMVDDWEDIE